MKNSFQYFWNNGWLLSIAAGILLGLSFPPFPLPFLQFPAVIFILRIITLSETAKQAAYITWPGFILWNLIVSYWLIMATVAGGVAAIVATAVLMSFLVMLLFKAQEKFNNGWLIALLQTAFWVSFEYLLFHWPLSWPWLSFGNGWANATLFIQYISGTGFLGISFWVMLSSTLIYQAIRSRKIQYKIGAAFVVLLFPVLSLAMKPFISTHAENKVQIVAIQPNFNTYKPNGGYGSPVGALNHLLRMSDSARTRDTKVILWPESAIYPYLTNSPAFGYRGHLIKNRLKEAAQKWNTTIIGGTEYFEYYKNRPHPPLPRHMGTIPYLTYNAAVAFYPNQTTEVYRKHNLVPVIERLPFVRVFNKLDVFNWVNWPKIQRFGIGQQATLFKADHTTFPALICYDSVYPGWVRNFIKEGAGFITVITNDGWWGNSSGHMQHFAYARLRAIEFRRWVVQDSNSGTSGVIAPDGTIIKRFGYGIQTAFKFNVPILQKQTFYTKHGDWLPVSLLGFAIAGIIWMIGMRLWRQLNLS